MIYPLALGSAFLLTGLFLVLLHGFGLWKPGPSQAWLRAFPRSKAWGTVLLVAAAVWSWLLVTNIDLGEFSDWRLRLQVVIPIAAYLTWRYVEEFLAARALGMLVLLAAEPLLEAAWLRPETSRLALVALVYIYIVAAMFWIGAPYVLRNQIAWVSKTDDRWRAAALVGLLYGAALTYLGLQNLDHLIQRHSA
jgi:hypothetical protein